jgi:hypothetical protein
MLYSGTDPESYITEYTLVYEDKREVHICWPRNQNATAPEQCLARKLHGRHGQPGCEGIELKRQIRDFAFT